MPMLGSGATVPCELTVTLVLPLLQSAAAVIVVNAVVTLQLAATTIQKTHYVMLVSFIQRQQLLIS